MHIGQQDSGEKKHFAGECERRVCSTAKPRTAVLALLNGNPPPIEVTAQDSLFAVIPDISHAAVFSHTRQSRQKRMILAK